LSPVGCDVELEATGDLSLVVLDEAASVGTFTDLAEHNKNLMNNVTKYTYALTTHIGDEA